jgi:hypothetical protein
MYYKLSGEAGGVLKKANYYRKNREDRLIVNPNTAIHQQGYEEHGWKYFEDLVRSCDGVVYFVGLLPLEPSEDPDSEPMGVWQECQVAMTEGKPVWYYDMENGISRIDVEEHGFCTKYHLRPWTIRTTRNVNLLVKALQESLVALNDAHKFMNDRTIGADARSRRVKTQLQTAIQKVGNLDFPRKDV